MGEVKMDRLQDDELLKQLELFPGWERKDQKWLVKKFRFQAYMDGIFFVTAVAQAAESMQHHPMIAIDYKLVTLSVTTWSAGGITSLDFKLMEQCDNLYQSSKTKENRPDSGQ
jgi:4a-hydroxytetrahydrobiopterin dehydratase